MPIADRPVVAPQTGTPVRLPIPARMEVSQGQVVMEWDEIERGEYEGLYPLAALAIEQKRTRTGKFVIYRTGGAVCTLTAPWHSPYANTTSILSVVGCFVLQETQAADRLGLRMVFFKGDEFYGGAR